MRTTYDRYGHLMPGDEAAAVVKLEIFLLTGELAGG